MSMVSYLKQNSPTKPYCTDDLLYGVRIFAREIALTKAYVQLNRPMSCHAMVFDIDRAGAAYAAQDAGLPDPSAVIITPKNRHAHVWYLLDAPVATGNAARQRPLDYLAALERTMGRFLGADMAYSGLITKNPLSNAWLSLYSLDAPVRCYTMQQLHEDIGVLDPKPKKTDDVSGFGRNCMLFDKLRKWGYVAIRRHRGDLRRDSHVLWNAECLDKAVSINAEFLNPLSFAEVRGIAKSTAKFCWKHDPKYAAIRDGWLAPEKQAKRGKMGGVQSGIARQPCEDKVTSARLMHASGMSTRQIGDELGVNQSTIVRWLQK